MKCYKFVALFELNERVCEPKCKFMSFETISLSRSSVNLITFLISFSLIVSCSAFYSKDKYVKDFAIFVNDVKDNCASFTEEQWTKADLEFFEFTVQKYGKFESELTDEDKHVIGKLKGIYNFLKAKKEVNKLSEQAKDLLYQTEGVLKEVMDSTNK